MGFLARSCHYKLVLAQLVAFAFLCAYLHIHPYKSARHHWLGALAMAIPALGVSWALAGKAESVERRNTNDDSYDTWGLLIVHLSIFVPIVLGFVFAVLSIIWHLVTAFLQKSADAIAYAAHEAAALAHLKQKHATKQKQMAREKMQRMKAGVGRKHTLLALDVGGGVGGGGGSGASGGGARRVDTEMTGMTDLSRDSRMMRASLISSLNRDSARRSGRRASIASMRGSSRRQRSSVRRRRSSFGDSRSFLRDVSGGAEQLERFDSTFSDMRRLSLASSVSAGGGAERAPGPSMGPAISPHAGSQLSSPADSMTHRSTHGIERKDTFTMADQLNRRASMALAEAQEIRDSLGGFHPNEEARLRSRAKLKRALQKLKEQQKKKKAGKTAAEDVALAVLTTQRKRKGKGKGTFLKRVSSMGKREHGGAKGREARRRARRRKSEFSENGDNSGRKSKKKSRRKSNARPRRKTVMVSSLESIGECSGENGAVEDDKRTQRKKRMRRATVQAGRRGSLHVRLEKFKQRMNSLQNVKEAEAADLDDADEGGAAKQRDAPKTDREALVRFYQRVAPDKVANVDAMHVSMRSRSDCSYPSAIVICHLLVVFSNFQFSFSYSINKFRGQAHKMYLVIGAMFPNETIERPAGSKAAAAVVRAVHSKDFGHADPKKDDAFIKI